MAGCRKGMCLKSVPAQSLDPVTCKPELTLTLTLPNHKNSNTNPKSGWAVWGLGQNRLFQL